MARRKKEFVMSKDDLCYEEPIDEICFTDYVPPSKDAVASFCFTDEAKEENAVFDKKKEEAQPVTKINFSSPHLQDNRHKPQPNGITPPINGEFFEVRRSYSFRKSPLIKLNQIKGTSSDYNIYMNTIIDSAICFYYDDVMKKS